MKKDLYEILGVSKNATDDEIKSAYRKLAAKYHPDVSTDENANERMAEINEAYSTLKDPKKRADYDQYGSQSNAYQQYESDGSNTYQYYNYNPNSTYYEYNRGYVFNRSPFFLGRLILRMIMVFAIIQIAASIFGTLFNRNSSVQTTNYSYTIDSKSTTATINGIKNQSVFSYYNNQDITIPKTIRYMLISYTVTDISQEAFYGDKYLKSVTMYNDISCIGQYAFYGCENLRDIYYYGTESEFKNIVIETGNSYFKEATVHYMNEK